MSSLSLSLSRKKYLCVTVETRNIRWAGEEIQEGIDWWSRVTLDPAVQFLCYHMFPCLLVSIQQELVIQYLVFICWVVAGADWLLLVHRRGNCKNVTMGMDCEVGLRRRTYNVLAGSVLSVWARVENVLAAKTGHNSKMQVVRLRTGEGVKIVGEYSNL
jgi:hypothetical protein